MPEDIILPTATIQPEAKPSQSATEPANDLQVPNEILLHIISFASQTTRATLMRTNKRIYALTGPILYRRVSFSLKTKRTIFDGLPTRRWVPQLGSRIKKPPFNRKRELLKFVQVVDMDHQESDHRNFERVTGVNLQDMEYTLPSLHVVKSITYGNELYHFRRCSAFGSERLDRPVHFVSYTPSHGDPSKGRCSFYTTCRRSFPILGGGQAHSTRKACGADLVPQQKFILSLFSIDLPWPGESIRLLRRMAAEVVFDTTPSLVVGLECLGPLARNEASQTADRSAEAFVETFHATVRYGATREALWNRNPEGFPETLPVYNLMTFREYADHHASDDIVPAWEIGDFISQAEKAREMRAGGRGSWVSYPIASEFDCQIGDTR